jgi:hypothetical protein
MTIAHVKKGVLALQHRARGWSRTRCTNLGLICEDERWKFMRQDVEEKKSGVNDEVTSFVKTWA